MTAQVFFSDVFSKKDPRLNVVELTMFVALIFTGQWINNKIQLSSQAQSIYFFFPKSFFKGIKTEIELKRKGTRQNLQKSKIEFLYNIVYEF